MLRMFKRFWWMVILAFGVERAAAFALLGPFEPYQVAVITYRTPPDIGGPMNLGEEFRRNKPVIYYSFDANYLDYFGSNGVVAVEEAISIFNALTNVSSYSADLSEWPFEAQSFNYVAQALNLFDVKSVALSLIAEQLGLAEPDRYTWTLHDRLVGAGGCPANVSYTVMKRNFDPVFTPLDQLQPVSYVNGTLYSYFIQEFCAGTPFLADAVEFPVDPLANTFTAVAAFGISAGSYYTGLTRDDVGGLRYMLRTNNMNLEAAGVDTLTIVTNLSASQLLFTSNLTLLVDQALTNDAAALLALYPDLVIASTTPIFTNVVTTNVFFYFTNLPWAPAGTVALVTATNLATNVATWFSHTFVNVITNSYFTNGFVTILTTNVTSGACGPFAPANSPPCTNITLTTVPRTFISGDYFILPTNSQCGVSIVSTQLTSVLTLTNTTVFATNGTGTVNANQQFSQTTIFYFTNHVFVIHPVACISNSVALRQGIERIRFVRRDFDSLLGRFFYPITNNYTLVSVTNNTLVPRVISRIVTAPDLLITAQDLASTPADPNIGANIAARNISYDSTGAGSGLTGPGTIDNQIVLTFDKVGPIFFNFTPFNLDEATQTPFLAFGSFDGSTNAPTVYPNGTSILNLENQVLIHVSPAGPALPDGSVGVNYASVFGGFTVVGGTAPYQWGLATGSPGLPAGLFLNSTTGMISGFPLEAGVYDFTIRLTDATGRFVDHPYTLRVTP